MTGVDKVRKVLWHLRHGGPTEVRVFFQRQAAQSTNPAIAPRRRTPKVNRGSSRDATFHQWPLPSAPRRRQDLHVATILDGFSRLAWSFEWQQHSILPGTWQDVFEKYPVRFLFVESAWSGNDGAWQYKLTGPSGPRQEFRDLLKWCRQSGIPTVFWNKEDPAHFTDFLDAAKLFDYVFTTDSNLLESYRQELGHDRVGVLQFAAQSAIHNPLRPAHGFQERDIAFGGMYFTQRHPERRKQMKLLFDAALAVTPRMKYGLEIFSRQLGGEDKYQFPSPYAERVVGSLSYPAMLSAYRGYKVFLNVNAVIDSPTMCARRIFEITACGTPVVSTSNPAISAIFPSDEVIQVDTQPEAEFALRALVRNSELRDRMVHKAQRRIWASHTYSARANQVLEVVGLTEHLVRPPQTVTALVSSIRPQQIDHVLSTLGSQRGVDVQLAYLPHGWDVDEDELRRKAASVGITDVVVVHADRSVPLGACLNLLAHAADGEVVAKIDDDDFYGPDYLLDQLNALGYSDAQMVGKQTHYVHLLGPKLTALRFPGLEHRFTDFVAGPTFTMLRSTALDIGFPELPIGEDSGFIKRVIAQHGTVYSADRFNFALVRGASSHTWQATEMEILASATLQTPSLGPAHVIA